MEKYDKKNLCIKSAFLMILIQVLSDNQSSACGSSMLASAPKYHSRNRHFQMRHYVHSERLLSLHSTVKQERPSSMKLSLPKVRMLTGDTPTGKLHLGHLVGSLENRVKLQDHYESFFIIADLQAMTKNAGIVRDIRTNALEVARDYLAVGIDPDRSHIFLQSQVPALAELNMLFSMFVTYSLLLQNPTIKAEMQQIKMLNKGSYSCGFLNYPISQAADILAFRPQIIPVGEDQLPHIELTRTIARKINREFFGVESDVPDDFAVDQGGLFPIPSPLIGRINRLIGIGKPKADGSFAKMSKSLDNAIFLSDTADMLKEKIFKKMYTDPNSSFSSLANPITTENNPLWIYHKAFNPDQEWVSRFQEKYKFGQVTNKECKEKLVEVLNARLEPIRKRRKQYEGDDRLILDILRKGTLRANDVAQETLTLFKESLNLNYFEE